MDESTARIQLVVREHCHLCEQARRVVRSVCEPAAVEWVEVDVDEDPARQRQYGELVPVVLVDGVQVDYWQIDPDRLRAALRGPDAPGRRGLRDLLRRRREQ